MRKPSTLRGCRCTGRSNRVVLGWGVASTSTTWFVGAVSRGDRGSGAGVVKVELSAVDVEDTNDQEKPVKEAAPAQRKRMLRTERETSKKDKSVEQPKGQKSSTSATPPTTTESTSSSVSEQNAATLEENSMFLENNKLQISSEDVVSSENKIRASKNSDAAHAIAPSSSKTEQKNKKQPLEKENSRVVDAASTSSIDGSPGVKSSGVSSGPPKQDKMLTSTSSSPSSYTQQQQLEQHETTLMKEGEVEQQVLTKEMVDVADHLGTSSEKKKTSEGEPAANKETPKKEEEKKDESSPPGDEQKKDEGEGSKDNPPEGEKKPEEGKDGKKDEAAVEEEGTSWGWEIGKLVIGLGLGLVAAWGVNKYVLTGGARSSGRRG